MTTTTRPLIFDDSSTLQKEEEEVDLCEAMGCNTKAVKEGLRVPDSAMKRTSDLVPDESWMAGLDDGEALDQYRDLEPPVTLVWMNDLADDSWYDGACDDRAIELFFDRPELDGIAAFIDRALCGAM